MGTLKYLPELVPTVTIIYGLVIVLYYVLFTRYLKKKNDKCCSCCCASFAASTEVSDEEYNLNNNAINERSSHDNSNAASGEKLCFDPIIFSKYFRTKPFEASYLSGTKRLMYLLLAWRVACFAFFFSVPFMWGYIRNIHSAFYFTVWNVDLITLYFALSMTCSILGCLYNDNYQLFKRQPLLDAAFTETKQKEFYWSSRVETLGWIVQLMYEVAGATAFFVTIVDFVTLSHKFELWNVSAHLMSSISLLFDGLLNDITVRWEHAALNLTWAYLYLIFVWIWVPSGGSNGQGWPYFFLDAGSPVVFIWYIALFILDVIMFYVFWGVMRLREPMSRQLSWTSHGGSSSVVNKPFSQSNIEAIY